MKYAWIAILVSTACAPLRSVLPLGSPTERLARGVTLVRDEWGVPHVLAGTDAEAAFGLGYVQAEDGWWQFEETLIHALGRASYWHGDRFLEADLVKAAFDVERLAIAEYEREPAWRRVVWDAFADGVNHYIRTSGVRPRVVMSFEPWMPFALVLAERADLAAAAVNAVAAGTLTAEHARLEHAGTIAALATPEQTASGNAMLIENARGEFFGARPRHESLVIGSPRWHVRGFTMLGTPVAFSGHNDRIAWSHVLRAPRIDDIRELTFDSAQPLRYRATGDAEWREAVAWQDTLRVNTTTGVVERVFVLRRTSHGAVIIADERAFEVRDAALREGGVLQQLLAVSRAVDPDGYRAAVEPFAQDAMDMTYADVDGNIAESRGTVPRAAADTAWTFGAWQSAAFDVQIADTEPSIAMLAGEWEQVGGRNPARARELDGVIDALRSWDGAARVDSEAATLYVLWQEQLRSGVFTGEFTLFRALEAVAARIERDWNTPLVPWGEVNRLRRSDTGAGTAANGDAGRGLAVGGAPWWSGSMFSFDADGTAATSERYGVRGTVSIMAIELGRPIRAQSVVVFGQSSDPASAHFFDQAGLYVRGELKPARFSREDVLSHARRVYSP